MRFRPRELSKVLASRRDICDVILKMNAFVTTARES
jgi:hypothetical protein